MDFIQNHWYATDSNFITGISICLDSKIIGVRLRGDDYFYEYSDKQNDFLLELFHAFYFSESKGKFYHAVIKSKKKTKLKKMSFV
jgi:hypothetical protein